MRARHWMIGCLIGLVGIGSAMAADVVDHDITTTSRSTTDTSARDAAGTSGDALGLNRDCPPPHHGSDAESGDADTHGGGTAGGSAHDGRISAPATAKPAPLGWQSLLPGSIQ